MITAKALNSTAAGSSRSAARAVGEYLANDDVAAAAREYYQHGEVAGEWMGTLAADWRLVGRAGGNHVQSVLAGFHPVTGKTFKQRERAGARLGFDFTFSAPKSVSIVAIEDPRIRGAFDRAVHAGFRELEKFSARRVRSGDAAWSNENEMTGNLVAVKYTHTTSRAGDPNLHAHVAIANVTMGSDGKTYALQTQEMMGAIAAGGFGRHAFWAYLGKELRNLGYQVERGSHGQPEIAGVSEPLRDRFSKRSHEMASAVDRELDRRRKIVEPAPSLNGNVLRQWLAARGEHWSDLAARELSKNEMAVIARSSRKEKDFTDEGDLQAAWRREMGEDRQRLTALVDDAHIRPLENAELRPLTREAMQFALAHVFERESVVQRGRVLAAALDHGIGQITPENLRHEFDCLIGGEGLTDETTIQSHLDREADALAILESTKATHAPISPEFIALRTSLGESWKPGQLSDEQAECVEGMLKNSDGVQIFRGVAGAGKTTSLQVLGNEIKSKGGEILVMAPSRDAVSVLEAEGFDACTTASFLISETAQNKIKPRTVLIVDEAGMLSTKTGAELLTVANAKGARIIFVGDERQHSSVEAGDFLRLIREKGDVQVYELGTVLRQKSAQMRQASELFARGKTVEGVHALDRLGCIVETRDVAGRIAADHLEAMNAGESHLSIAPTHRLCADATTQIREAMLANEKLGGVLGNLDVGQNRQLTAAQRRAIQNYRVGDIVTFTQDVSTVFRSGHSWTVAGIESGAVRLRCVQSFQEAFLNPTQESEFVSVGARREIEIRAGDKLAIRQNHRKAGLINGEILTATEISISGEIRTQQGKTIPGNFRVFDYGYVITSHKSQGRTTDSASVAAGLDAKALYVSTTRHKQAVRLYTEDKSRLLADAERSGERKHATDVIAKKPQTKTKKMNANTQATMEIAEEIRLLSLGTSPAEAKSKAHAVACGFRQHHENWNSNLSLRKSMDEIGLRKEATSNAEQVRSRISRAFRERKTPDEYDQLALRLFKRQEHGKNLGTTPQRAAQKLAAVRRGAKKGLIVRKIQRSVRPVAEFAKKLCTRRPPQSIRPKPGKENPPSHFSELHQQKKQQHTLK